MNAPVTRRTLLGATVAAGALVLPAASVQEAPPASRTGVRAERAAVVEGGEAV